MLQKPNSKESRMQKQLVVTVIGTDKPGIVESLADVITQQQGNWLGSSMSELMHHIAHTPAPDLRTLPMEKKIMPRPARWPSA